MDTINKKQLQEELFKRLSNPKLYADRTLILWGTTNDGLVRDAAEACCDEYNKEHHKDEAACKRLQFTFKTDDLSFPRWNKRGIVFCGDYLFENDKDDMMRLLNTHKNDISKINENWVVLACYYRIGINGITPELFGENCDQFEFVPLQEDFEEWASRIIDKAGEAGKVCVDFIRENIKERWYVVWDETNPFAVPILDSTFWEKVVIDMKYKLKRKSLNEISKEDLDLIIRSVRPFAAARVLVEDLYNFIHYGKV